MANRRETLRQLLQSERPLVMPDAYDALSARLIEAAGFKAVQCSGFSMALAARCVPEQSLTIEDNLRITTSIVQAVNLPVMADGEDGYGPPERVAATVQAFCTAGVAGINIEDQVLPPSQPRRVVARSLMTEKLRAAREAANRSNMPDLVINGRTDALAADSDRTRGLREAVERGNQYLNAGADLIFVTGVATLDEVKGLVSGIKGPVSITAGMPPSVREMSICSLRDCGVARVSLPTVAVFSALQAVKRTLALIYAHDDFDEVLKQDLLCSMQDVTAILTK